MSIIWILIGGVIAFDIIMALAKHVYKKFRDFTK